MRFKEFYLTERPIINSLDKREVTYDENEFEETLTDYHIGYKDPDKKFKIGNILYGMWKVDRADSSIKNEVYFGFENSIISRKTAVIFCGVSYNKKFDFPSPGYILVKRDKRGNKIGYDFYEYLINTFGGIVSDNSISTSIFKIYSSLAEKYHLYFLNSKNMITHAKSKLSENDLNDFGSTFMITKEKLDPIEWNKI